MYPSIPSEFPEFVADQVLTSENLNNLFDYLDEQDRLTRVNLIGIGIVCGLELKIADDGSSVTITKGVGVTSAGYHVAIPETTYTFYHDFDAEQPRYYDRFVDGTNTQRFPLFELEEPGSPDAEEPVTSSFLADKVILLFVELLEVDHRNCDPDSCDDTGVTVTVNIRPLAVEEANVHDLIGVSNGLFVDQPRCIQWPRMVIGRYNVPATLLPDSASILKNFLQITNKNYLASLESGLTQAYNSLQLLVADNVPSNPFNGFAGSLSFLHDGSISVEQLVNAQYYYDHVYDIVQAYEELRCKCSCFGAVCGPDEDLFPRHLLLGPAFATNKAYRHFFIPSPAVSGKCINLHEIRDLLLRLIAIVKTLEIPAPVKETKGDRNLVRITPSKYGDVHLSDKAIPYYYRVKDGVPPLFSLWATRNCRNPNGNESLSYHAALYNNSDPDVYDPLSYELERYNFYRIEGHIGRDWRTAFKEIYQIKQTRRLPFDVVALNGDFKSLIALLTANIKNLGTILKEHPEKWKELLCYFGDIELEYDMIVAELRCIMAKAMRFLYMYMIKDSSDGEPGKPVSQLLLHRYPQFQTQAGSLGEQFDHTYPELANKEYIPASTILGGAGGAVAGISHTANYSVLHLMYYLEKVYEILPDGIVQLDVFEAARRMIDLATVAQALLNNYLASSSDDHRVEALILHLNAIVKTCKGAALYELYKNFLFKFYWYLSNQSFAMYSFLNSGIDHKAGVPRGGTFILVYHDKKPVELKAEINSENLTSIAEEKFRAEVEGESKYTIKTEYAKRKNIRDELTSKKMQSLKNNGVNYLRDVLEAKREKDEEIDAFLRKLIEEIPDNTVIADFYLPFVCKSDCMSMNFFVLGDRDEEETEAPTIRIEDREYCNLDERGFEVVVSPEGGKLEGEGAHETDNGFAFGPGAVAIPAGADRKEVTLTYSVGDQTASVTVIVFAQPSASFAAETKQGNLTVQFKDTSTHAKSFVWDFGGGNKSEAQHPTFTFEEFGTHTVTLTVTNGPCSSFISHDIPVEDEIRVEAKCIGPATWRDSMISLDGTNNDLFMQFREKFAHYDRMHKAIVEEVGQILTLPPDALIEKLNSIIPPPLIARWMKMLQEIILSSTQLREFAREAYRILLGLLFFYACAQDEDIAKAEIKTHTTFNVVIDHLGQWNQLRSLTPNDKKILAAIAKMTMRELENAQATAPEKTLYMTKLKTMIELMST